MNSEQKNKTSLSKDEFNRIIARTCTELDQRYGRLSGISSSLERYENGVIYLKIVNMKTIFPSDYKTALKFAEEWRRFNSKELRCARGFVVLFADAELNQDVSWPVENDYPPGCGPCWHDPTRKLRIHRALSDWRSEKLEEIFSGLFPEQLPENLGIEEQIKIRYRERANCDWQTDEIFDNCTKYFIENIKRLKICPECSELYGPMQLYDGKEIYHKCACGDKRRKDQRSNTQGQDSSKEIQLYENYETCYCCGLELIPCGTKWSSFFCLYCHHKIQSLNMKVGSCVIPIGRNSVMNGVSLSGGDSRDSEAVSVFVDAAHGMFTKIDLVEKHHRNIVKRRLQELKLPADKPVIDLLVKTDYMILDDSKDEAFLELLTLMTDRCLLEVSLLYDNVMKE